MTTNKNTSHRDCTHPNTKTARARCRKDRAVIAKMWADHEAENQRYHDTYVAPYLAQKAAADLWETESAKFCSAHVGSADQNASDTARELGFEDYSIRWYETAVSTLHSVRDDAYRCLNPMDPENGQLVELKGYEGRASYRWIDGVIWATEIPEITVVDEEGNRTVIGPDDIQTW